MDISFQKMIDALVSLGPAGAFVAALLIACGAMFLLYLKARQLLANEQVEARIAKFQVDILEDLRRLRDRERELEQLLAIQRDQANRLEAIIGLYREATARLFAQVRLLKAGRITAEELELPELPQ
jgi:hypothetical protein